MLLRTDYSGNYAGILDASPTRMITPQFYQQEGIYPQKLAWLRYLQA